MARKKLDALTQLFFSLLLKNEQTFTVPAKRTVLNDNFV
jgi:hypothetical protein